MSQQEQDLRELVLHLGRAEEIRDALEDLALMMAEAEQGATAVASQDMLDALVRDQVEYIAEMLGRE